MIKGDSLFTTDEMTKSDRCLHTPGNFAKQNLLYVQEAGYLKSLQPHKCIREKLDSFLLIVVLEGKGSIDISGKHYEVSAGDCAFIDCMEHYEHISDEKDAWKLCWVHFNGNSAKNYYELFLKNNNNLPMFHVRNAEELFGMIREIMASQKERNILSELRGGEQLLHLMNIVLNSVISTDALESEQEKRLASEIREYINIKYVKRDIMSKLENHFSIPCEQLGTVFSNAYRITMEEYISNRRYNAAKELLRFSVKNLEEVAKESGIGDVIVMEQLFRDNEGASAEEYRRKWAGWVRN